MSLVDILAKHDTSEPPVVARRERSTTLIEAGELDHELEDLTSLALRNMREILEPEVDFDFPKIVAAKMDAAGKILNAQVRVDEGRLRKRKQDMLPALLKLIAAEEGKSNALTVAVLEG